MAKQGKVIMLVFYILLFVPILIQHIEIKGMSYKKRNRFSLACFFVLLTLLIMFRHETVGKDTENYRYFFQKYAAMPWKQLFSESHEFGFTYYNKLISCFTKNPQVYLAITAAITSALIYPTYRRLCTDSSLTIVLFCLMSTFVMMFSGIRQMLAIALGVRAYEFVRNNKLILYGLTVALAVTFHVSAIMLLLLYPAYHLKITKKWLYGIVPTLLLIFVFNRPIFTFLGSILARFTQYDATITSTGAYSMLILFVLFTIFAYVIPDEKKLDQETIALRNILLIALAIQLFAPLHTLAMRMNYYFIIFIPLLMPKIVEARSKKYAEIGRFGRHVMVLFFLAYFFLVTASSGSLHVFPYHFFWEAVA